MTDNVLWVHGRRFQNRLSTTFWWFYALKNEFSLFSDSLRGRITVSSSFRTVLSTFWQPKLEKSMSENRPESILETSGRRRGRRAWFSHLSSKILVGTLGSFRQKCENQASLDWVGRRLLLRIPRCLSTSIILRSMFCLLRNVFWSIQVRWNSATIPSLLFTCSPTEKSRRRRQGVGALF